MNPGPATIDFFEIEEHTGWKAEVGPAKLMPFQGTVQRLTFETMELGEKEPYFCDWRLSVLENGTVIGRCIGRDGALSEVKGLLRPAEEGYCFLNLETIPQDSRHSPCSVTLRGLYE
ncbi:MAG: hypothetical protein ACRCXD_03385 [Luteolibacter sp.]